MKQAIKHPSEIPSVVLSAEHAETHRALLLLIGLGAAIRLLLMILYYPAVMLMFDSPRYARIDAFPLYGDFWMPAGYPMFLWLIRAVSDQMWVTISVQHLLGLGTGVLLYFAVRRLGVSARLACLPAAVVFLSGDHLYFEHMVMADFLLTFFTAAGLCAAVYGFTGVRGGRWIAVASVCLATAVLMRSVGIILLPILALCAAFWVRGPWRQRALTVSLTILPGLGVLALYFAGFKYTRGEYLGLSDMRGWNLYSRVAPFADCKKFVPPGGTAVLCEERKSKKRPGPFGYVWDLESVPRKTFALGPATGKQLEAFAFTVIRHQPRHYVRAVLLDLARYVEPSLGIQRPYGGQPREILSFGWRDQEVEQIVVEAMKRGYRGTAVTVRAPKLLAAYQNVLRLHGFLLVVLLGSTVAGLCFSEGTLRLGTWLFGLAALGLYLLPVATVSYDFRYGIPPGTFLVVSGVLGAAACFRRVVGRREPGGKMTEAAAQD